jgi:hypothetical protein
MTDLRDNLSPITAELVLTSGPTDDLFGTRTARRARLFRCAYPYDLNEEDTVRIGEFLKALITPLEPDEEVKAEA